MLNKLDESLLRPLPPFSKLENGDIRAILDQATHHRFEEGVTVFEEGDKAAHFYLLLDGTIRVVRITLEGEFVTALHIPAGQLFGIAKALGQDRYPATAMAASEVLVLSWPTSLWSDFVSLYDGFASETYKTIGSRVNEMNTRIVEISTQHVEQRIARALMRLINQSGKKVAGGVEISFPMTRRDISEMTGTTHYTASRVLSAWEKEGLIISKRKRITVCDPHRMTVLSGI